MGFSKLTWGVKASFCGYVEAMEGSITVSDGATRAADGSFEFTAAPGGDLTIAPDGSATGSMRFQGSVAFDAHGGMLKATLTELGVDAGDEGLVLSVLDAHLQQDRVVIAKLGPVQAGADGAVTLGTEITLNGMYQIADNYPPGTPLDPVIIS